MKQKAIYLILASAIGAVLLVGCASAAEETAAPEGTQAMVEAVTVESREGQFYARVEGNYPDACTRVSDVQQTFDGSTFQIVLMVDRPPDLMCAQVITPFTVDILLETGGVAPGEYEVDVNGITAAVSLG